ncbi:MAG: excinuclease ABC subunit UvrA [Myxococcota bacterium]
MKKYISIKKAAEHNLKNIDLDLPREKFIVVCGPSGSGKSTLGFDLIYAEGQRRYVESLSAYARQFLPKLDKPKVKEINGLSPAISIEQYASTRNPRSTVGTVTEIHDFLRVFFARLGEPHCPVCKRKIEKQTGEEIVDDILKGKEGKKFYLLTPLVNQKKGRHEKIIKKARKEGFSRLKIDDRIYKLEEVPTLEKNKKHTILAVMDRLKIKKKMRSRLADSVELALVYGDGKLIFETVDGEKKYYNTQSACPVHHIGLPDPEPHLFSFNSPDGSCEKCHGIGSVYYYEPDLIAPNRSLSINQGGLIPFKKYSLRTWSDPFAVVGEKYGFNLDTPLEKITPRGWEALFEGDNELDWIGIKEILKQGEHYRGRFKKNYARFRQSRECDLCQGARLNPVPLAFQIEGINIDDFTLMPISSALQWLLQIKFTGLRAKLAAPLVKELVHRLKFLNKVGLNYLSLSREMSTVSGGEAQRIRLASQLGGGLVGVIYVLDEPTIGLHQQDNRRLLNTLRELQSRGNTVIVIEHDEQTMREADHLIELGPGSGKHGGNLVFQGSPKTLLHKSTSLTAKYLRGDLKIEAPETKRKIGDFFYLRNVRTNNLKNIDLKLPWKNLICVTGVSGSGKSSLVVDTLYNHLSVHLGKKAGKAGKIDGMENVDKIKKCIMIDQSPIGRTPRSNPATYTKVFDQIRDIFASLPESKARGYQKGRFSFNVQGGRCEACRGEGIIKVEMHFLPDVFVKCDLCEGRRYNRETLDIEYRGKNIADVLEMTVEEAVVFFANFAALQRKLQVLKNVGLDYIQLGQPATTLSGGEAQRIKISRELGKRNLPGTLYILDEPTTGLHQHEVGKLIEVLHSLVNKGATAVVIEHNLNVIRAADYIIDLGPGGGDEGGRITAEGTPEEIMNNPASITGKYLKESN